jgi:asparagine synthase (glutamine-hydrolysing)
VPIRLWLREDKYYKLVREYFTGETSNKYFNQEELVKLLDSHKSGKADNSRKIWTLFVFLVWYGQFFDE